MIQTDYKEYTKARSPKRPVLKNCVRAFFSGGLICLFGQILMWLFTTYFNFDDKTAGNPTITVLIFISVLLTGLGVYDVIAQFAGGGTAVPITGFANTITSAAIEHRSEGYVLGVGSNMFRIAGPVIVFGLISAFVVAILKYIIIVLGGI